MIYAIAGALLSLGAAVVLAFKRALRPVEKSGAPAAEEAKIEAKTAVTAGEIAARSEQQKQEVANADPNELLAKFRDSLRRK